MAVIIASIPQVAYRTHIGKELFTSSQPRFLFHRKVFCHTDMDGYQNGTNSNDRHTICIDIYTTRVTFKPEPARGARKASKQ